MKRQRVRLVRRVDLTAVVSVALALGGGGCVGNIGDSHGQGSPGSGGSSNVGGATNGSGGSNGGGSNKGSGGSNGSGSNNPGGTTSGTGGSMGGSSTGTGGGGQLGPVTLDSGRTVLRRLNRTEFNLTVRDLLGTSKTLADTVTRSDTFPDDAIADGFDTVGLYLSFSELLGEAIEGAAGTLMDDLFARPASDPVRTKILSCTLTTGSEAPCARTILTAFARRAFRRPATTTEIDRLMALVDKARAGGTYQDGLKAALTAVLISPHFLFREETSVGVGAGSQAKPLSSYELATRLSYFFWSTMPDDQLAASADSGMLATDTAMLSSQINRMLQDPKASTLTTNFATRWLTIYRLDSLQPDMKVYPTYDDALRVAAQKETSTFFSHLISDDLPLTTLIDADFTYANARLGKHYGISVTGDALTRVSLAGTPRKGLLTQASVLMGNAHPDSSSPVKRGDWILDRILCSATPPPPNNIVIPDLPPPTPGKSSRQLLEDHQNIPGCASCHVIIDPVGFALENFDGIGAYRTMDNGVAVNASGTYPGTNAPLSGATDLAQQIAKDPRFAPCVTKQLLTYGVGRSFAAADGMAYATSLAAHGIAAQQNSWRSWIAMVAASEAFRTNWPDAQ